MIDTEKYIKNIDTNEVKIGLDLEKLKKTVNSNSNIILVNLDKILDNQMLLFDEIERVKIMIKK